MNIEALHDGGELASTQDIMSPVRSRSPSTDYNLTLPVTLGLILLTCFAFLSRLLYISYRPRPGSRMNGTPTHILVVLGSGGHTAEMLSLLRNLDTRRYTHRTYIVSSGDDFSASLAREFEARLNGMAGISVMPTASHARVVTVPRARRIHQSLLTAPATSLWCFLAVTRILTLPWPVEQAGHVPNAGTGTASPPPKSQATALPDVIITNGPATGVIVVLASYFLRFVGRGGPRQKMRTVYVESWARVKRLSLSGRILLRLTDRFVVQWESLKEVTGSKAEFLGVLV